MDRSGSTTAIFKQLASWFWQTATLLSSCTAYPSCGSISINDSYFKKQYPRTHNGCGKTAIIDSYFKKQHPRTHDDELKLQCPHSGCSRKFADNGAFKTHVEVQCKFMPRNADGTPLTPPNGTRIRARRQRKLAFRARSASSQESNGTLPELSQGSSGSSANTSPEMPGFQEFTLVDRSVMPSQINGTLPSPAELQQYSNFTA